MAKINNTTSYPTATPTADSIVIGSTESDGDTKNFLMSAISTFVLGNAVTPTLDDVCQQGNTTTTSIQINNVGGLSISTGPLTSNGSTFLLGSSTVINGTVDINNTADISGNTTIGGTLGVTGLSTLDSLSVTNNTTIGGTLTLGSTSISGSGITTGTILSTGTVAASFLATDPSNAPASATATGTAGSIVADADYIYVCTATDTWKRVAIATW